MARELGPVMFVILLAGCVDSTITAELASMKVYQEIDALETMNIPPARIPVMPRLVTVLVMVPVLTNIADLVGWFGGAIVSKYTTFTEIDPPAYFSALRRFMTFEDMRRGLSRRRPLGLPSFRSAVTSDSIRAAARVKSEPRFNPPGPTPGRSSFLPINN